MMSTTPSTPPSTQAGRSVQDASGDSQDKDIIARAYQVLETVADPEIPVITLLDLGIIRSVEMVNGALRVGVSPTYSGCPATAVIRASVIEALQQAGFEHVTVMDVLSPPWTSDWISVAGRDKLREYGITPPAESVSSPRSMLSGGLPIACPRCNSLSTEKISEFGSTPCKAHYRCISCREPFDYFKCI
jgi:ring-1,2-phenylacetyl-CoA epoxidase subunit PaaD